MLAQNNQIIILAIEKEVMVKSININDYDSLITDLNKY